MKAQHFARNILAAAVLSALGAHAAVAADFSEGVYENHGEQDVYDNFIVKNTAGQQCRRPHPEDGGECWIPDRQQAVPG